VQSGAIVNFFPSLSTEEKLRKARVSYAKRGLGIRLSPHAFNRDDEIDAVIGLLK
jgi:selenocysteine lyase/cysteine desulfurase